MGRLGGRPALFRLGQWVRQIRLGDSGLREGRFQVRGGCRIDQAFQDVLRRIQGAAAQARRFLKKTYCASRPAVVSGLAELQYLHPDRANCLDQTHSSAPMPRQSDIFARF